MTAVDANAPGAFGHLQEGGKPATERLSGLWMLKASAVVLAAAALLGVGFGVMMGKPKAPRRRRLPPPSRLRRGRRNRAPNPPGGGGQRPSDPFQQRAASFREHHRARGAADRPRGSRAARIAPAAAGLARSDRAGERRIHRIPAGDKRPDRCKRRVPAARVADA